MDHRKQQWKEVIDINLFGLSIGTQNTKLGPVYSFSLPSKTSCPGASTWCLKHCYAYRYERRRPKCREAYQHNLQATNNPNRFTETMIGILPRLLPCFRIHVCGDFVREDYASAWINICQNHPNIRFWGYTRSWASRDLLPTLERLRALPNVQMFGSTDHTMPRPPKGWRVAYLERDSRAEGLLCPEQNGKAQSCLDCGYCFQQSQGNVVFKIR